MSQQKDSDPEEYKRLHSEKEAHLKRIQQLTEDSTRLKNEVSRWGIRNVVTIQFLCSRILVKCIYIFLPYLILPVPFNFIILLISLYRTNNLTTSLQNQIQNLRDSMSKITDERNMLKKEVETKNQELLEKGRTITQVKKIGRRYKTQYDELKLEHDKVRTR